jgi:hypothetical protein
MHGLSMRNEQKSTTDRIAPIGGAKILLFRRPAPAARKRPYRPISDPLRRIEEDEDRQRIRENIAAAVIVLILVTSGFWLIDHLRTNARIATCLETGHHNCLPFDLHH